jgi:hypothetical protein
MALGKPAGGPGQPGDLDHCARGGPDLSGPCLFPPALAVPAAASMEAAGHAMAKAAGVCEPCTMIEAASHTMVEVCVGAADRSSMICANSHAMTQAVAEFAVATIV